MVDTAVGSEMCKMCHQHMTGRRDSHQHDEDPRVMGDYRLHGIAPEYCVENRRIMTRQNVARLENVLARDVERVASSLDRFDSEARCREVDQCIEVKLQTDTAVSTIVVQRDEDILTAVRRAFDFSPRKKIGLTFGGVALNDST